MRVVVFQPLSDGKDSGDYIVVVDGFAGRYKDSGRSQHPIFMQVLYRAPVSLSISYSRRPICPREIDSAI